MYEVRPNETMADQENASTQQSRRSSVSKLDNSNGDLDSALERPAPSYLNPFTARSSATQSIDNIENLKPVRPKSFTGTGASTHDEAIPPVPRYPSDVCNFDFTDEGGPIISFIRSSGVSNNPRNTDDDPRFGSIEIVRTKEE